MLINTENLIGKYLITPTILLNETKINQINEFLDNHSLAQLYQTIKNFPLKKWMFTNSQQDFWFSIITTYKTKKTKQLLNYSTQHYKQMLKILQEKYFDKLYQLFGIIEVDFPMYCDYVQLMFKYMLFDNEKLIDCIAKVTMSKSQTTKLNHQLFLQTIKQMMLFCTNEQLKTKTENIIVKKIENIIVGIEKGFFIPIK